MKVYCDMDNHGRICLLIECGNVFAAFFFIFILFFFKAALKILLNSLRVSVIQISSIVLGDFENEPLFVDIMYILSYHIILYYIRLD